MFGADGEVVRVPIKPRIRRLSTDDPVKARFIDLVLRDPAAARRERIEAKRAYWVSRLEYGRREGDVPVILEAEARLRTLEAEPAH